MRWKKSLIRYTPWFAHPFSSMCGQNRTVYKTRVHSAAFPFSAAPRYLGRVPQATPQIPASPTVLNCRVELQDRPPKRASPLLTSKSIWHGVRPPRRQPFACRVGPTPEDRPRGKDGDPCSATCVPRVRCKPPTTPPTHPFFPLGCSGDSLAPRHPNRAGWVAGEPDWMLGA